MKKELLINVMKKNSLKRKSITCKMPTEKSLSIEIFFTNLSAPYYILK